MQSHLLIHDTDEIIDQLTDDGTIIGPVSRAELIASGSRNFRLVSAMIRTTDGDVVLFRRAHTKKSYPGLLASVGGCVQSGETYVEALVREVQEEIGIHVPDHPWRLLGYTSPKRDDTIGHVAVYEIICNPPFAYNQNDFMEYCVLSLEQWAQLCREKKDVTHNVPIYFNTFYTDIRLRI